MLIIASIAVYAVFTPGLFKPSKVTITGAVTTPGVILNKIAFTNTGCGTRNEAVISSIGANSGTYTISLDNEYSYNVSIAWNNGTIVNEMEVGVVLVETFDESIEKNWVVQP
jgi:hypothetical protein